MMNRSNENFLHLDTENSQKLKIKLNVFSPLDPLSCCLMKPDFRESLHLRGLHRSWLNKFMNQCYS